LCCSLLFHSSCTYVHGHPQRKRNEMSIKTDVNKELEAIGTSSVPASQDVADKLIHEYNVATLGESYFKKRRDKAKTTLLNAFTQMQKDKIDGVIISTKRDEVGTSATLIESSAYILQVKSKNGAEFVDMQALKVTLARKYKLTTQQIEELITECTDRRDPSLSYEVVERQ